MLWPFYKGYHKVRRNAAAANVGAKFACWQMSKDRTSVPKEYEYAWGDTFSHTHTQKNTLKALSEVGAEK